MEKNRQILQKANSSKKQVFIAATGYKGARGITATDANYLPFALLGLQDLLKNNPYGLLMIGEGSEKNRLKNKYEAENVLFAGYIEQSLLPQIFNKCDLGIAPVIKGIENVAFPSKIISYLVEGLPICSFSSANSEISKLIQENNFGINYDYNQKESLSIIIEKAFKNKFNRDYIKESASKIFSEKNTLKKWDDLIKRL